MRVFALIFLALAILGCEDDSSSSNTPDTEFECIERGTDWNWDGKVCKEVPNQETKLAQSTPGILWQANEVNCDRYTARDGSLRYNNCFAAQIEIPLQLPPSPAVNALQLRSTNCKGRGEVAFKMRLSDGAISPDNITLSSTLSFCKVTTILPDKAISLFLDLAAFTPGQSVGAGCELQLVGNETPTEPKSSVEVNRPFSECLEMAKNANPQ